MFGIFTRLFRGAGGLSAAPQVSFTHHAVSAADAASYTFLANLGTPSATRKIVVGVSVRAGIAPSISSVTVAGVAATLVDQVFSSPGNFSLIAMYVADVPTGASGNVVVTLGSTVLRCGIGVWALKSSSSNVHATSADVNPLTGTLTVPAGGVVIGYAFAADSSTPRASSWTVVAEDFDETVESSMAHSGAHALTSGSQTITCSYATAPSIGAGGVFAAFGP